MEKNLEWTKPVLVELGNAKRVSFGQGNYCNDGQTDVNWCNNGNSAGEGFDICNPGSGAPE